MKRDWRGAGPFTAALIEAEGEALIAILKHLADMPGPIIIAQTAPYNPVWLMTETSTSINTTAAGGNASLMTLG